MIYIYISYVFYDEYAINCLRMWRRLEKWEKVNPTVSWCCVNIIAGTVKRDSRELVCEYCISIVDAVNRKSSNNYTYCWSKFKKYFF